MDKLREALQEAIVLKAMADPIFLAHLLMNPQGFLKEMANHPVAGDSRV